MTQSLTIHGLAPSTKKINHGLNCHVSYFMTETSDIARKLQRTTELSEYKMSSLEGNMKSAKSILEKMAFNPNAPDSTKQALLKAMQKSLIQDHKAEVIPVETRISKKGEQLAFNFSSLENIKSRSS